LDKSIIVLYAIHYPSNPAGEDPYCVQAKTIILKVLRDFIVYPSLIISRIPHGHHQEKNVKIQALKMLFF
jgi:hypothetical protein